VRVKITVFYLIFWGIGRNHLGQLGIGSFSDIELSWNKSVSSGDFAVK